MEDLKSFVTQVVADWEKQKGKLYEGLSDKPSNVEAGTKAENYIKSRLKWKDSDYMVVRTPRSRSPIDLIGFCSKRGYKHFTFIQVKSSTNEKSIYNMNESDWALVKIFIDFFKKELYKTDYFQKNKKKLFVFSSGDAKVLSPKEKGGHQKFISAMNKHILTLNKKDKEISSIKTIVKDLHNLV